MSSGGAPSAGGKLANRTRNSTPPSGSGQDKRPRSTTPAGSSRLGDLSSSNAPSNSNRRRDQSESGQRGSSASDSDGSKQNSDSDGSNQDGKTKCPYAKSEAPQAACKAMQQAINKHAIHEDEELPCFTHLSGKTKVSDAEKQADLIAAIWKGADFIVGRGITRPNEHDPRGQATLEWSGIFNMGTNYKRLMNLVPEPALRILFMRCVQEVKLINSGTADWGIDSTAAM